VGCLDPTVLRPRSCDHGQYVFVVRTAQASEPTTQRPAIHVQKTGRRALPAVRPVHTRSESLVPVCSPKLLSGRNRITQASDLLKLPLLRLDGWTTWSKWFETAGVSASARRGPVLNQASMLIDAAIDGQGVALARTTLAAWDLLHGRLVVPIDVALPLENTYWIVYPKLASHEAKVVTLRDWLLAEAADDERRLRTVVGKGYAGTKR
jgi:LysR family transcriptional regulator, glycine cleavage system transcriptional activator